ncbi:Histidine kinase-, DNA gyrase B-, and HSP90-like ATPase [Lishizhenia tianjinensis]|uniref:Histidine kinase-, DNA gyrase B-, and HSP90-like ATPase n=1 Tax=Lishizhenia tianjinensis TaxID=477690 RepID=A0A1I6YCL8_9FLAO|nr:histidine kinase [Lishizhenia tianjinensis]SFT48152.1 Histidine kinase-, DNA gyrase B-, and HSP90-like ATPase [Lishizhenia tianjinensis]
MTNKTSSFNLFFTLLLLLSTSLSFGQDQFFSKLDSLNAANNDLEYIKELHRLNDNYNFEDEPLVHLKIYVKMVQYYRLHEYSKDSIIKYYQAGKQLATQENNQEFLCNLEFLYGSYLIDEGQFDKALEVMNAVRPVIEKEQYEFLPHLYDSYAKLYYLTNNPEKAFDYLKIEAAIFKQRNDIPNTRSTYNNLGILYSVSAKYDSALYYHQISEEINKQVKDTFNLIKTYSNIANLYLQQQDLEKADSVFRLALDISSNNANNELIINYVDVLIDKKEYKLAEELLIDELKKIPATYLQKDLYRQLMAVNKAKGDYQQALTYSEKLREVSEIILDETKIKAIERLTVEFETEQKEQEIANLHILTNNQQLELSRSRLLIIISITLLVVVILVFLLFYRTKSYQTKLNQLVMEQKLLRSKMNPHFIFNSLSNIQTNILKGEKEVAIKYLAKFAKLLRYNLEHSTHDSLNFSDEMKSIEDYLDMQNLRLNGALTYLIEKDESLEMEELKIPGMMIQPIVENSLEHGLEGHEHPKIWIKIKDEDERLIITVEDNGVGLSKTLQKQNPNKKSFASDILKRRLAILSKKLNLELTYHIEDKKNEHGETTGAMATLILPVLNL